MIKKMNIFIIVFCILISLSGISTKAEEPYEVSKYFPLDIGNKWVYQVYTLEEAMVEHTMATVVKAKEMLDGKEVYSVESNRPDGKHIFYYSLDRDGIKLHKAISGGRDTVFSPPITVLFQKSNPERNDSALVKIYDTSEEALRLNEALTEGKFEIKSEFEGTEDITVPAGKFEDCQKIYISISVEAKNFKTTVAQTDWYARGIGKVKETKLQKNWIAGSPELEERAMVEESESYSEIRLKEATIRGQKIGG
ncbi:hypothetical protein KJA13_02710 [Patescibacteria group bacterium]|nr:hypothetical protein [Patescibacteria group bacterium]